MPNLETFLAQWRQTFSGRLTPEKLDELESHLRERIEQLVHSGMPEPDACHHAAAELGHPLAIAREFHKLGTTSWLPAKIMTGLTVALALTVAILLIARPSTAPGAGLLLTLHVFAITLGYATALFLGVLGACFVLQRAFADFPPARLAPLSRVTRRFATVATAGTALGVFLSMLWTHREWNRIWAWDPKETGGLCVLLWMVGFLAAHWFRRISPRALLVASTLGANVVLLAWFSPHLSSAVHPTGLPPSASLLLAALLLNLLLTLLGLAPAGCLRLRKMTA